MSLATYYKYRAINNDRHAQEIIRQAVLKAERNLSGRPGYTQSFEDAAAQFLMIRLMQQLPNLFTQDVREELLIKISQRAKDGIKAPDTSNRAALSAAYWQYIINQLHNQGYLSRPGKEELGGLINLKITKVLENDVTSSGWYLEGEPMAFNPHYHVVTAFAFLAYGEFAGSEKFILAAQKMTANIRQVTFSNGMVEARLGARPVGLGAQFYLGTGLLNQKFNFSDYGTYLSYMSADRFFF